MKVSLIIASLAGVLILFAQAIFVGAVVYAAYTGVMYISELDKPIAESIGETIREVQTDFNRGNKK